MLLDRCLPVCNVGVLWPNDWMDQHVTWCGGRPSPWPHCVFVLHGDLAPPKGHNSPQFSTHVYCGQTAGWIKMPLGTEVDLGPGHIVLGGDPAPPDGKGHSSPQLFSACLSLLCSGRGFYNAVVNYI